MTTDQRPGESFWVGAGYVRSVRGLSDVVGSSVRVVAGPHKGERGVVRQFDGATGLVQIRTGDPAAWAAYDAETRRLLTERGYDA